MELFNVSISVNVDDGASHPRMVVKVERHPDIAADDLGSEIVPAYVRRAAMEIQHALDAGVN